MGLQIHSVHTKIGINSTPPVQTIRQPRGELRIEQPRPELVADRELPKVLIDQTRCFSEAGLKNVFELTEECAALGRYEALQYIGTVAGEGDEMSRIEDGRSARDVLAEMAERRGWPVVETNIDCIPKSRPKIEVSGHLRLDWRLSRATIEYRPQKAMLEYQPGAVQIYLRQRPELEIRYVDERG